MHILRAIDPRDTMSVRPVAAQDSRERVGALTGCRRVRGTVGAAMKDCRQHVARRGENSGTVMVILAAPPMREGVSAGQLGHESVGYDAWKLVNCGLIPVETGHRISAEPGRGAGYRRRW